MPDQVPYQLSIAPALEQFRPELEYACAFLDRCHYVTRAPRAPVVLHYGPGAPAGAITVPAAVFPDAVRLDVDGIHPERQALRDLELGKGDVTLIPQPGRAPVDGGRLVYDALGLIFLMLSRLEERDSPDRDRYGRFPLRSAMACPDRLDRYADPLADQAARALAAAITVQERPANRTTYEVYLTHDVCRLGSNYPPTKPQHWRPLRWAVGDVVKRFDPKLAWKRLSTTYLLPKRSLLHELMQAAERVGRPCRFFIYGPYVRTMPKLLETLCAEIASRGHVIGFHPRDGSASDPAEWMRQRDELEAVIGHEVRQGRQHQLKYDAAVTPDIWDQAGMELDCTLAFPETSGFRSGSCRPHQAYSLRRRQTLSLTQVSTAIMDFRFFKDDYPNIPLDKALEECTTIINICRQYGGTLAVLYHPQGPTNRVPRSFYRELLTII